MTCTEWQCLDKKHNLVGDNDSKDVMRCTHKPLAIDCDSYDLIWNALEAFRTLSLSDTELNNYISAIQKQLDDNIMEQ